MKSEKVITKRELINLCLELPQSYEDYPFDDVTPVIRHKANKKMFALVGESDGRLTVSLKCDPIEADFLRRTYNDVRPGHHFNKRHWNTLTLMGDVPFKEVKRQIEASYDLIKPKIKSVKK